MIIEALASGLPVAGYTVTGPKDIITEPFLGDIQETCLLTAAKNALNTNDWQARQARADHVKSKYTWEKAATQFETAQRSVAPIKLQP